MGQTNTLAMKEKVAGRIREMGGGERLQYLRHVPGLIDLTNLSSSAKKTDILKLCETAATKGTAAICVNPSYTKTAREALPADRRVKLAVVAAGFPLSQTDIETKAFEVSKVREHGADEVDIVINQGALLSGDVETVRRELRAIREASGNLVLKVILEVCELSPDMIRLASVLAIEEGANCIKTSTGFGKHGATPESVIIMLDVIAEEHARAGGRQIGLKPAGGIKTPDDALTYMFLVEEMVGAGWLQPNLFRFGASSLLASVLTAIGGA